MPSMGASTRNSPAGLDARSNHPAVRSVLEIAGVTHERIRAIGVTRGPGLIGPLLVGLHAASELGLGWSVPVIGINHLRGHLRSADLEQRRVTYPAVILLVSGGQYFPCSYGERDERQHAGFDPGQFRW